MKRGIEQAHTELIKEMHEGLAEVQMYRDILVDTVAPDCEGAAAKWKRLV